MATPQANWIGRTIGGRYKLEGILGQGGMSAVYRATDPNLQRKVAVKLIHPHLSNDPEFVRRFEQEAAAVAQLRHPNIVQVYDFNHDGPTYFMVLEYIPGETLQARLKAFTAAGQRLPLTDTIDIMTTVCEAVAYAHNRGMVHRDLKPANVMLNLTRQPILMDFGVAKMLGGVQHTATGAIIGSAKYMSPEQARGEHPDERADIYSMGVMLYEMAAGQPPFEADSDVAVLMKHASQPVPDVRQLNRNTPDQLVAVIEKALAKNRADRYQSVNAMLQALREVESATHQTLRSGTMPPTAAPSLEPIQKSKIPMWLVGAAAAVLLVLVLGVGAIFLAVNIFRSSEEIPPVAEEAASGSEEQQSTDEQAVSNEPQVSDEELNLPSSAGMVKISEDSYIVGREASGQNYASPEPVSLSEFWIDQHEVTNAEYAQFIDDTGGTPPESWPEGALPAGQENHPVKTIPWDQAVAYCEWAKKRLPTEAEWEVAARGPDDALFPWGDDMQAVDLPRSGTYEVGSIPLNRSPFGVFDMAGNVWEWVGEPYAPVADGNQVLRGGENGFLKDMAYRLIGPPNQESIIQSAGIRCAADEVRIAPLAEVLFEDSFVDPSSGWPTEDVEGQPYRVGYHPPDYYHVEVRAAGQSEVVTREESFDDVTVETNVFVDFTDTDAGDFRYGLTLRRIGEFQYYAFTISPRKGSWQALKHSSQGARIMAEGRIDTLAELGSGNRDLLRVDASGPDFIFHINGHPVAHVNDGEYTSGEVGFYVETLDESLAHVHFDDLVIGAVEDVPGLLARVLFEDEFTDPESGWLQEDIEGQPYRVGYHPPDYYHVEVRTANESEVVFGGGSFADASIEADVFVDFTDTEEGDFRYGLALRGVDQEQFYAFTIDPRSGSWQALKHSAEGVEVLAEGAVDGLVGLTSGERDVLRVDARGAEFVFLVNGEQVGQMDDADYASGEVGFYVETLDETLAHIHYDALTVREVEEAAGPIVQVLYDDQFTDPESGWLQEDVEGQPYRVGYHPPDYYHVEVRTANESEVIFGAESFENASIEADVFVDFTDTEEGDFRYGLALRGVDEEQFYAFTVDPRSESWQALKHSAEGVEILTEGGVDNLVGLTSGERDVLRVDAQGATFVFYVNGEQVGQVDDADYASGEVGFYVETLDETLAHIHYDALTVREVEELPAPIVQVFYDDQFTDPESGWVQEDIEGQPYRVGYHPPDYYHVEVRAANESEVIFGAESFEDATVETQMFVDFTDTEEGDFRYGLVVRAFDEEQFYAFTIDPRSENWQALKHSAGDIVVLAEGTVDGLVGLTSGERDVLRVDAQGATFVFHINGEPVTQVEDEVYASGAVGFYVETFDESLAHIHYDALVVQEVDTSAFDVLAPAEAPAPEVPDGMALVPAGYFEMGTASGRAYEGPAHPVFLDAFYMDLNEVTNAQYRECVQARSCTQAGAPNSATRTGYRDDLAFNDYPIIRVTWDQANAYCQWAGKHLPTEAQWEYAAGGPDHLTWPWGNTFQGSLLPAGESDTQAVGSYPEGASSFGLFDMAGNVAEWVLDDFSETFYADAPPSNPVSADVSAGRVFRGGSFGNRTAALYSTTRRDGNIRTYSDIDVGFRCALDAPEVTPSEERATLVAEFCEVYTAYKPGAVCP